MIGANLVEGMIMQDNESPMGSVRGMMGPIVKIPMGSLNMLLP